MYKIKTVEPTLLPAMILLVLFLQLLGVKCRVKNLMQEFVCLMLKNVKGVLLETGN